MRSLNEQDFGRDSGRDALKKLNSEIRKGNQGQTTFVRISNEPVLFANVV